MTRITLCSAKGSPGVTTLACALGAVWPAERAVVVAECDPSGGDLAGRFGLSTRLGMTSLVLTERQRVVDPTGYRAHVQQLPGGLDILVAPAGADSATALDVELGTSSCDVVTEECDLLADCGRLLPGAIGQEKMIRSADNVLLLVRPDAAGIAHARWAVCRVRELSRSAPLVVIVGMGAFKPGAVAEELEVNVLGVVPFEPRAAQMACGAPGTAKEFIRSGLVAFAREIVAVLIEAGSVHAAGDHWTRRRSARTGRLESRHRMLDRLNQVPRPSKTHRARGDGRTRAPSP
jgi:MinD-like ATPase involved in chromosome partitioning or flagellar assembly